MANEKKDKRPTTAASNQVTQKRGFSKGTVQGLVVCAVLLVLLTLFIYVLGVPPGTAKATLADALLGLLIAVAGVWVVGGMIKIKTSLYGIDLKAFGGIAILLVVVLYFRPFYGASGQAEYADSITLDPCDTIGTIISFYEDQFGVQKEDGIQFEISEDIRKKVMNFRAYKPGSKVVYQANWGFPRRNPVLRILDQIEDRQKCLKFKEEGNKIVVELNDNQLKLEKFSGCDEEIYVCK